MGGHTDVWLVLTLMYGWSLGVGPQIPSCCQWLSCPSNSYFCVYFIDGLLQLQSLALLSQYLRRVSSFTHEGKRWGWGGGGGGFGICCSIFCLFCSVFWVGGKYRQKYLVYPHHPQKREKERERHTDTQRETDKQSDRKRLTCE